MLIEIKLDTPTTLKKRVYKKRKGQYQNVYDDEHNFNFLNVALRLTKWTRPQNTRYWKDIVSVEFLAAGVPENPIKNWYAHFIWHVPKTMDFVDNVPSGAKHIMDAASEVGIIADDAGKYMGRSPVEGEESGHFADHEFVIIPQSQKKFVIVRISDQPFFERKRLQ